MENILINLKDYLDLGGIFVLAVIFLYIYDKHQTGIEEKLTKILVLVSVIAKESNLFNHTDNVLGKDAKKVKKILEDAKNGNAK